MRKSSTTLLAIFSSLYYVTAIVGMQVFSLQPQNITLLWLPLGIGLVMCLKFGWRACFGIFIASFAANFPGMITPSLMASIGHTAIAGATDALTPLFTAELLRRKMPSGFSNAKQLLPFCFYACFIPTVISASVLAINLAAGGYIDWSKVLFITKALILADSLGILLIYPIFSTQRWRCISFREILLFALTSVISLALIAVAFHSFPSAIYLILPALLYLALSGYRIGYPVALLITIVATLSFAAREFGPFMGDGFEDSLMRLMTFVFSTTLVSQSVMLHRQELAKSSEARELWYQRAIRDALTGLYNRVYFMTQLNDELARSQRSSHPCVLAMIDVDFFKKINDQHGHPFGDKVLQGLAQKLQESLRNSDVAARIGGEEFAVLMSDISLEQAALALEKLRLKLSTDGLSIGEQQFPITVSMGACENSFHSAETLIDAADKLLYQAKNQGRNRLVTGNTQIRHFKPAKTVPT